LVTGTVTMQGWLVAGGLAISGVGMLAALLGLRGGGSPCAPAPDRQSRIDRLATYASPSGGTDTPASRMATEGTHQEFEQIVGHLTTDYPALGREPGRPWSRPVLIAVLVVGPVGWGLLSIAMVAWGWRGIALTGGVVAVAALAAAVGAHRRRAGR
jgi:hypothetical protein